LVCEGVGADGLRVETSSTGQTKRGKTFDVIWIWLPEERPIGISTSNKVNKNEHEIRLRGASVAQTAIEKYVTRLVRRYSQASFPAFAHSSDTILGSISTEALGFAKTSFSSCCVNAETMSVFSRQPAKLMPLQLATALSSFTDLLFSVSSVSSIETATTGTDGTAAQDEEDDEEDDADEDDGAGVVDAVPAALCLQTFLCPAQSNSWHSREQYGVRHLPHLLSPSLEQPTRTHFRKTASVVAEDGDLTNKNDSLYLPP
jgi:hypothetical protein